jgi:hypothetical protein
MNRTLVFAVTLASATPAMAICAKPEAPVCAVGTGVFQDNEEFELCEARMEAYRTYAETYGYCRQTELADRLSDATIRAQRDLDEVADRFTTAVNSFNLRAEKKAMSACP